MKQTLRMHLPLEKGQVDSLVQARTRGTSMQPELVTPDLLRKPTAYNRLKDLDTKQEFRVKLMGYLKISWSKQFDAQTALKLEQLFVTLTESLEQHGATMIGDLINQSDFEKLVSQYTDIMKASGNFSWIHSYVNLGNFPQFLSNPDFNGAFLDPLLIALIAYQVGGPIRMVDARAKDAEPISVLAQDNMLHIDNTPFRLEFKVILTWERGKVSGPKGQNFVFIPGTHKGARNCRVLPTGEAYSTENASIFITENNIDDMFAFQRSVLDTENPMVVEAHHPNKPLTTVFSAGSLVHHRFRTKENCARSCMILAFHRAADYPGQLIKKESMTELADVNPLNKFIFGFNDGSNETEFLDAISFSAQAISKKLLEINSQDSSTEIISPQQRVLTDDELKNWKSTATKAPTVEQLKMKSRFFQLDNPLSTKQYFKLLVKMMSFDKHGPLDLILYEDGHEEPRKWARNKIREMKADALKVRLEKWFKNIKQAEITDLQSSEQIANTCHAIVSFIDTLDKDTHLYLNPIEKIPAAFALKSIRQLLLDLSESIVRCSSRQEFLSTSLFVFWTVDLLIELLNYEPDFLKTNGNLLLNNYISTYILIEKQIHYENPSLNTRVQNETLKPSASTFFPNTDKTLPCIHHNSNPKSRPRIVFTSK